MKIHLCFSNMLMITLFMWFNTAYAQGDFQLNGQATSIAGAHCYQLTPDAGFGSMWFRKKADLTKAFDISARLYFGTKDGNGADGITFAFQNLCTSSGGGGGGLGIGGVSPSVFVEFDTYRNTENGDPGGSGPDHIGIFRNGVVNHGNAANLITPVPALANSGNIENGQYWPVRIVWDPVTTNLKVFFDGVERLSYTGNIVANVFSGNPYVYWGFTASTGFYTNDQRVCISSFPTNVVKLDDVTICQGDAFQASLPGGDSYEWSPNYRISNTTISNPILTPEVNTEYIVSVRDQCSNVQKDTIMVTVNPLPVVSLASLNAVCNGSAAFTLSGGSPSGGVYSGTGVSGGVFNPSTAGVGTHTITYTFTNSNNCTASATRTIQVLSVTNASIASFSPVCVNAAAFTLTGGSPAGGVYSGSGVSAGSFNPSVAGVGSRSITYTFTAGNGCVSTAVGSIQVNAKPNSSISSSQGSVICSGVPLTLNASTAANTQYQWFLNSSSVTSLNASNTSYSATAAGTYTLRLVNAQGCEEVSPGFIVTTGSTPTANLSATKNNFCPGESITLSTSLNVGQTVAWFRNGSLLNGVVGSTHVTSLAGNYTTTITSSNGCSATSTAVTLNLLSAPTASLSADQLAFCPGTTVVNLNAIPVATASYTWYKDDVLISGQSNVQLAATADGVYKVMLTLPNGCSTTSSVVSLPNATSPQASISSTSNSICQGTPLELTAVQVADATYTWFKDALSIAGPSTNRTYNASAAGAYYVQVRSNLGCVSVSNTLTLAVKSIPSAVITTSSTQLCSGTTRTITSNLVQGASYEWFRNNVSLGSASTENTTLDVSSAGAYRLRIDDGCPAFSNTLDFQALVTPSNAGSIGGLNSFCPGAYDESYTIASVSNATDYLWEISPSNRATIQSGQGTRTINVHFLNQGVTIKVTPRNACGTGVSSSKTLTVDNNTFCTLGQTIFGAYPTNACQGSTVTFYNYTTNPPIGTSIRWNFGAGANPSTANGNGPHQVRYTTTGTKNVRLEYVDNFSGFVLQSEIRNNYINIASGITTSSIVGADVLNSCTGVLESYGVTPTVGSNYTWETTGNATISTGQGTAQVSVLFQGAGTTLSVTETSASGCSASKVSKLVTCSQVTSVDEFNKENQLQVFPNPTAGMVYLKGIVTKSSTSTFGLIVYDAKGEVVYAQQGDMTSGNTIDLGIDLSHLPKGLYTILMNTDLERWSQKLIIQ